MDITSLLSDVFYTFPHTYSGYYLSRVQEIVDRYKSDISKLVDADIDSGSLTADINRICNTIYDVIKNYTFGHAHQAHVDFFHLADYLKPILTNEIFTSRVNINLNGLYKIRNVSNSTLDYACCDNYIIPFDHYNLIGTNRFSIPGYPCLYLGSSSYVCSAEVPKVKNKVQIVSRYEMWDGVLNNVLYLHYTPKDILHFLNEPTYKGIRGQIANSYLRVLPILMVIYHRVQHVEGPFRPEYIVSQMITQWARKNDIHAICYLSTKVDYSVIPKRLALNFAFPSQTPDNNYVDVYAFDHKFQVSRPLLLKRRVVEDTYSLHSSLFSFTDDHGRIVSEPKLQVNKVSYWKTFYGKADHILQNSENIGPRDPKFKVKTRVTDFKYEQKHAWI